MTRQYTSNDPWICTVTLSSASVISGNGTLPPWGSQVTNVTNVLNKIFFNNNNIFNNKIRTKFIIIIY